MAENAQTRHRDSHLLLNFFVIVLLLLLATWAGFYYWSDSNLEKLRAEIRAKGYPVTPGELDEWYKRPPSDNDATEYYLAAVSQIRSSNPPPELLDRLPWVGNVDTPPPSVPLPEDMKRAMAEYLQSRQEAINLLLKGSERSQARYPLDFNQGIDIDLAHLASLRESCRILSLAAVAAAVDGEKAVQYIKASLNVGESLADEPVLISQLVRLACHGISVDALRQDLHRASLTDEQLAALQAAFLKVEERDTFYKSFVGEAVMGTVGFAQMASGQSSSPWGGASAGSASVASLYKASGLFKAEQGYFLKGLIDFADAARTPVDERLEATETLARRFDEIPRLYILCQLMMPALTRATDANVRDVAYLRCARTVLAVERYRLAHGELPSALDALAGDYLPSVLNDPFTGQPLRYLPEGASYVVYSFGHDREDDKGVDISEGGDQRQNHMDADVAIRVERQLPAEAPLNPES